MTEPSSTKTPTPIPDPIKCTEHKALCGKVDAVAKSQDKTETRRWSLIAALAGSVICFIVALVTMGLNYGEIDNEVEHLERDGQADRAELRRIRQDMLAAERRDVKQSSRVLETVTEIKTKLDSLDSRVGRIEESQREEHRHRRQNRR